MDITHWRSLERFAAAVRLVPNLAPPIPELGPFWNTGTSALGRRPGSQRARRVGSPRVFHRRNVCSGEKRGLCVGKTKRGKGTKIMAIADRHGLPVAVCTESASPAEVKLVARTIEGRFIADPPARLIGDKAYDSDPLDAEVLQQFGTEMIAPNKKNRRADRQKQDGRTLRRFARRWKIERLFAWLYNFRRLVVRYEYKSENYLGFLRLACVMILLRHL